ncbi:MAG: tetratricopeptide repeat protein [Anaerolineales bacterium]
MPKGAIEDTRVSTAAAELRDMLHEFETDLVDLDEAGGDVIALLRRRDKIGEEVSRLESQGLDLRPEKTRIETIDNILSREASTIASEARAAGGLQSVREKEHPPESHWWWYLDEFVAEKRRKKIIKTATIVVSVLIVLITGNFLMDRFFGLSPREKEARIYTNEAEQEFREGNYQQAIAKYEKAVEITPSDGQTLITLGVLYELQGRSEEAEEAFNAAEETIDDRLEFLMTLAQTYMTAGEYDTALDRANEAIEIDPEAARAYLVRGSIYESMEERAKAIDDFQRSADLAQSAGQDALYVLAKMRLATLLQQAPSSFPGGAF